MKIEKIILIFFLTITINAISFAQQTITGKVTDETGNPISGVNIRVVDAEISTTAIKIRLGKI